MRAARGRCEGVFGGVRTARGRCEQIFRKEKFQLKK